MFSVIIIYIPICFYFNDYKGMVDGKEFEFTFQYVSILIRGTEGIALIQTDLHSNMFLF